MSSDPLLNFKDSDAGGKRMTRVLFHDPFVDREPISMEASTDSFPVPAPARTSVRAPQTLPPQGREREVQQLIHDLAVLVTEQDLPLT